jgi:tetratricopeptide (TPR) repeat protein
MTYEFLSSRFSESCGTCGQPAEDGYEDALCPECRNTLVYRPFPAWIKVGFVVIGLAALLALIRFPNSLEAGTSWVRGKRAEAERQYPLAIKEYERVLEIFSDSTEAIARLGIVYCRNGDDDRARETLRKLAGRKLDKKLAAEIASVVKELDADKEPAGVLP